MLAAQHAHSCGRRRHITHVQCRNMRRYTAKKILAAAHHAPRAQLGVTRMVQLTLGVPDAPTANSIQMPGSEMPGLPGIASDHW